MLKYLIDLLGMSWGFSVLDKTATQMFKMISSLLLASANKAEGTHDSHTQYLKSSVRLNILSYSETTARGKPATPLVLSFLAANTLVLESFAIWIG